MQDVNCVGNFCYLLGPAGPFTAPSPNGGAGAVVTGSFSDPNGNVTPTDPTNGAWYYQDGQTLVWWQWSVADQVWYQGAG